MVCFQCGTDLDEDAKFCPSCGTPLDAELTVPTAPLSLAEKPSKASKSSEVMEQDVWTCKYSPLNLLDSFVVIAAIVVALLILHANLVSCFVNGTPINLDLTKFLGFRKKEDWLDTVVTGLNYIFYGAAIILGIIYLLKSLGKLLGRKYHISTERVLIRRGLIVPHLYEMEMQRIDDIIVKQGFIGRFLVDTGDVLIVSNDSPVAHPVLEGIRHPVYVKELVRVEMKKTRRR